MTFILMGYEVAMRKISAAATVIICLAVAGCDHMTQQQQRALSGGTIGAVGGAAVGALAGGGLVTGALIGGAGGAAIGALTSPSGSSKH
jgi:hypothetical protein